MVCPKIKWHWNCTLHLVVKSVESVLEQEGHSKSTRLPAVGSNALKKSRHSFVCCLCLDTKAQLNCCDRDHMGFIVQKCTTWLVPFLKFQFYGWEHSFSWHRPTVLQNTMLPGLYLLILRQHFIFSLIVLAYSTIVIPISLVPSWLAYLIA